LAQTLFQEPELRQRFVDAVSGAGSACPGVLWTKDPPAGLPYLLKALDEEWPRFVSHWKDPNVPAGRTPLHAEGYYYCLDFSSVFEASAVLAVDRKPDVIVDVCAAPGGKSIFAWKAFSPRLLVSNEVIGKRTGALASNLDRCGVRPGIITRLDSQELAELYPSTADLVIVDAPCSGQSLPARGVEAPGACHPKTINMNANRQRRIIANSARVVAPGGHLAYMTCTYSREENEGIVEWFLKRNPQFEPVEVPHLAAYRSSLTDLPCYRLWPFQGMGAGGFTCLLRITQEGEAEALDIESLPVVWSNG
jgi:16S rRNA C967 or C1407 C5-methylase (RsmB/RsmF family)